MTIPAQVADAVANSRVKIAAGNGDYLDEVVVALWDRLGDQKMRRIAAEEANVALADDLQVALALLRRWYRDGHIRDDKTLPHDTGQFTSLHPTANEQPKAP